jgi:hypothetical protein
VSDHDDADRLRQSAAAIRDRIAAIHQRQPLTIRQEAELRELNLRLEKVRRRLDRLKGRRRMARVRY